MLGVGLRLPPLTPMSTLSRGITYAFTPAGLPPGVDFARSGAGSRVTAAGLVENVATGLPRFDHDPTTLAYRGMLVEPAATNVCGVLGTMAVGTNGALTQMPAEAGPDGATGSVWRLVMNSGGSSFAELANGLPSDTYTVSAYVRRYTAGKEQFQFSQGTTDSAPMYATESWQRFAVTFTSHRFYINNGNDSYATDILLWMPQIELGTTASSVILAGTQREAETAGLPAQADSKDVRVTYDDGSTGQWLAQTITAGWWPAPLARPRIRRVELFPAGSLG
ncbi:MAG: hypothetical protein HWE26_10925 [Alteromonadaceae bacterium]|nr:hypothetical protein [Alteromonadaceae bacterium]